MHYSAGITLFGVPRLEFAPERVRGDGDLVDPGIVAMNRVIVALVLTLILPMECTLAQTGEAELWREIKSGGHVVLMRHAIAPGNGDPEGFTLGDCSTQRNLSISGVQQAEKAGNLFRKNGIRSLPVYSSEWCRCLDTATAMSLGDVQPLDSLNSFYQQPQYRQQRTEDLKTWLLRQDSAESMLLVTHQVNITALTGVFLSSGEMVVVKLDQNGLLTVVGSVLEQ